MRMCRVLRSRVGPKHSQVTYGSHMAVHMALGFQFMGAGRFAFSRSPEAIAALVCALFPKFPIHSTDNRYHLQAYRHLYVLAVEPRVLILRDVVKNQLCFGFLTYVTIYGECIKQLAPCMLPELKYLESLVIDDPYYWPIRFEKGKNWDLLL